ncbi:MAG: glycosyltransferase family 4 protein [Candidatus Margulisiibacteriota bacterium]
MPILTDNHKKVLILANVDYHILKFKLPLINKLVELGYDVTCAAADTGKKDDFLEHGIRFVDFFIEKSSLNVFKEIRTICRIYRLLKKERPDTLHAMTIKPLIYGSIIGRFFCKNIIIEVAGLGYIYTDTKVSTLILRKMLDMVFWISLNISDRVIFLNRDDLSRFSKYFNTNKAVLIKGAGIDAEYFSPTNIDNTDLESLREQLAVKSDSIVFTMISRLLASKGIWEYSEMARALSAKYKNTVFLLAGYIDFGNPMSIKEQTLVKIKDNLIFLGKIDNVRDILALTDIFVLPSYREGMPITILEAMSMEKPVIATDVPGCREVVRPEVNGLLVEPRSVPSLLAAAERLIADKELRTKMGENGRRIVLEEYSNKIILEQFIKLYGSCKT